MLQWPPDKLENRRQINETNKATRDRRHQNKGRRAMGRQAPRYRPSTFFAKLGRSPSRRLYEINAGQGNVMCPSQLRRVEWLYSYTICQLHAKMYFGDLNPRVDVTHKIAFNQIEENNKAIHHK